MNINYFGSVGLTKAVLPKMIERKSGHIIFVSSIQGLIVIPDSAAYAASKHAMQAFGDSLRSEMHQHNINVTVVSPGHVKTAVSLNALTGSGDPHGVSVQSVKQYRSDYVYNSRARAFYNFHTESVENWRAKQTCETEGAKLIVLSSEEDVAQAQE